MTNQHDWVNRYDATMMHNFGLPKRVFVRGEGVYLWDADGNKYTDMFSGIAVTGLGQAHRRIRLVVLQAAHQRETGVGIGPEADRRKARQESCV